MITNLVCLSAGVIGGFFLGLLVMRNNYKHFKVREDEIRQIIAEKGDGVTVKFLKIRNKLDI